ncbi:MAG TPA: oligopeptidase A [Planctomycetes bacterium]|nr:oligopeptidase A [Planctomycetota bacterium]
MSDNPLLYTGRTPRFRSIQPAHVEPAVRQRISEYEAKLEEVLGQEDPHTWATLIEPLEAVDEALGLTWGPVEHLNSVMNSDELREAYKATKPLLTEFVSKIGQDARLYAATQQVLDSDEGLDEVQRRVLELSVRDFRLAGVDLPEDKKARYREIQVELSQLSNDFQDHLIDETKAYKKVIEDPAQVEGLPESLLDLAHAQALQDDPEAPEQRWTFTLQAPSVAPFLQFQPKRELREELYRAYTTRATEGELDNSPLIDRILELRVELAQLLGFENYAQLSLETKMAKDPAQVVEFLNDLAAKSKAFGEQDVAALRERAQQDGVEDFQAYDKAYYRELLRQERFSFSDEEVRQYFPLPKVLEGLFSILSRLYGLQLSDVTGSDEHETWHDDVQVLRVDDEQGLRGFLYLDLFSRDGKRQGAWMNECLARKRRRDGTVQAPVAYLVCNFAKPVAGKPSLLRHGEVETLFHEAGHCLHHVLTKVDYRQVSGINEVPWDGVELPSQFHENWVWQPEGLSLVAGHHETGEPLPQALLDKMLAAKNYQSGADMLRQLEFALFDLELHSDYQPGGEKSVQDVLDGVRERVAPLKPPAYDKFQNGFGHIFSGGYAAGYYSYKWAEVLAADAFSRFEEEGLFSPEAGKAFRETILEQGGSRELMDLYVEFRGREPSAEALLRHSGLVGSPS